MLNTQITFIHTKKWNCTTRARQKNLPPIDYYLPNTINISQINIMNYFVFFLVKLDQVHFPFKIFYEVWNDVYRVTTLPQYKMKCMNLPRVNIFLFFASTFFSSFFWQRKICNDHFHMSKLIPLFENIVVQGDMNSWKGDTSIFMYSKYSLLWIVIFPFSTPILNSTDIKS